MSKFNELTALIDDSANIKKWNLKIKLGYIVVYFNPRAVFLEQYQHSELNKMISLARPKCG